VKDRYNNDIYSLLFMMEPVDSEYAAQNMDYEMDEAADISLEQSVSTSDTNWSPCCQRVNTLGKFKDVVIKNALKSYYSNHYVWVPDIKTLMIRWHGKQILTALP